VQLIPVYTGHTISEVIPKQMKQKFHVGGMTCSACSARVDKAVRGLDGITDVTVNVLTNSMVAEYDESRITDASIIAAVTEAGYTASVSGSDPKPAEESSKNDNELNAMFRRMILSFVLLIPLMYVAMGHMIGLPLPGFLSGAQNAVSFAFAQFLLCLPIIAINQHYYKRGFKALLHHAPNMDTLITIGSSASLFYGIFAIFRMSHAIGANQMDIVSHYHHDLYFESAVMILAFINLGKYLEARAKGKTGDAIEKLVNLSPKTALIERNGTVAEYPADQIRVGDIIHVKPGAAIPTDGIILSGDTAVDESAITGESIPKDKSVGDAVIGATINKSSFFKMEATKIGSDTALATIIRLVEEAGASKAPIAKLADRVAGIFVPVVMALALLTCIGWMIAGYGFEFALSCGICVLVISCPCALGLATPVSIMVGTGKGAENGILIKSGEALETAHNISCVVLDKTGTVTEGRPQVTDVYALSIPQNELIAIAAALESGSEHPIASAIVQYAKDQNIPAADSFETLQGRGISAQIAQKRYYIGNLRLMDEIGISCKAHAETYEPLESDGKTTLFLSDGNALCGILSVADTLKPTSKAAIDQLKALGIQVLMLTGDNEKTARHIQQQTGIDRVIAEVLPQEKEAEIAKLAADGHCVAMVGDGINDAPALVRADVGIAIGAGTDIAIESADIVLMRSDLSDVPTAIRLSKAVIRNIKQNLFWAFFYNTCMIPIAAGLLYPMFGLRLSPMLGSAAMSLSSLFVVSNALRLKLFRAHAQPKTVTQKTEEPDMITMKIEGMMCGHCKAAVEKALNAIDGVTAEVNLEAKTASVQGCTDKELLRKVVTDAGYDVISVE